MPQIHSPHSLAFSTSQHAFSETFTLKFYPHPFATVKKRGRTHQPQSALLLNPSSPHTPNVAFAASPTIKSFNLTPPCAFSSTYLHSHSSAPHPQLLYTRASSRSRAILFPSLPTNSALVVPSTRSASHSTEIHQQSRIFGIITNKIKHTQAQRQKRTSIQMTNAPLLDAVELLAATAVVIPIFRKLKLSPILGFLLAGVVLGPHGFRLVKDVEDITELADFGVLFLLFEMGLELSLERLKKLRKYAFGLGTLQVFATTTVLGMGAYAMGASVPESVVIGSALSLSSSAFVLSLLGERGERNLRSSTATFGVLLAQDIVVVPLLVLVPLLSTSGWAGLSGLKELFQVLGYTAAKALGVLTVAVIAGGSLLKQLFQIVASSKSSEAFTAMVLLTVLGTAFFTEEIGLSMTLGAFVAGVLLAESSFRSQIMADTEPFRGLLLGLFFITTGMSMDLTLFISQPLTVFFLITSLIGVKASIAAVLGLPFGLTLAESVKVGLLIGQGGEFAFVLFALANKLGFLPGDINELLVVTVVASMALTPLLASVGARLTPFLDRLTSASGGDASTVVLTEEGSKLEDGSMRSDLTIIMGYGNVGRVVAEMLNRKSLKFIAVDNDPKVVLEAKEEGVPIIFGDTSRLDILEAAGIEVPAAFVITHSQPSKIVKVLTAVRQKYPSQPVFVKAKTTEQRNFLSRLGATATYPEEIETSLQLGSQLLRTLTVSKDDIFSIQKEVRLLLDAEMSESIQSPGVDRVTDKKSCYESENESEISTSEISYDSNSDYDTDHKKSKVGRVRLLSRHGDSEIEEIEIH